MLRPGVAHSTGERPVVGIGIEHFHTAERIQNLVRASRDKNHAVGHQSGGVVVPSSGDRLRWRETRRGKRRSGIQRAIRQCVKQNPSDGERSRFHCRPFEKVRQKKSAGPSPPLTGPRPRGIVEQQTRPTPHGGVAQGCCLNYQEPFGSGWSFPVKQFLDAHASIQIVTTMVFFSRINGPQNWNRGTTPTAKGSVLFAPVNTFPISDCRIRSVFQWIMRSEASISLSFLL